MSKRVHTDQRLDVHSSNESNGVATHPSHSYVVCLHSGTVSYRETESCDAYPGPPFPAPVLRDGKEGCAPLSTCATWVCRDSSSRGPFQQYNGPRSAPREDVDDT